VYSPVEKRERDYTPFETPRGFQAQPVQPAQLHTLGQSSYGVQSQQGHQSQHTVKQSQDRLIPTSRDVETPIKNQVTEPERFKAIEKLEPLERVTELRHKPTISSPLATPKTPKSDALKRKKAKPKLKKKVSTPKPPGSVF
jgi:hypothetical protein